MKTKSLKLPLLFFLLMIVSCDEPEIVVTDIVHPDGAITRRIEMKNFTNKFDISDIQVPFDTTWTVRDSIELYSNDSGTDFDTIWIKRAEKLFKSVDELNLSYIADSGSNREAVRHAEFKKTFKWFSTEYTFSEVVGKRMDNGYPVSDFMNEEELKWFFSPDFLTGQMREGPDSLKYRALEDSLNRKRETWILKCLASEWSSEFVKLTEGKAAPDVSKESLKAREDELVKLIGSKGNSFDSLWNNGIFIREFLGMETGQKLQAEADSAASLVMGKLFFNFDDYNLRIIMPGKLTRTNGFTDSTGATIWPVRSDLFLSEPYIMKAESKTPNKWTWYVTGIFLLAVAGGITFRIIRK